MRSFFSIVIACILLYAALPELPREPAERAPKLPDEPVFWRPSWNSYGAAETHIEYTNTLQEQEKMYPVALIAPDQVGFWHAWMDQWPDAPSFASYLAGRGDAVTPNEVRAVLENLDRMSSFFRELKVLNPPIGMAVYPIRNIGAYGVNGFLRDPGSRALTSLLSLIFNGYYSACETCKPGLDTIEPVGWIHLWVNNITVISGRDEPYREDERGPMFPAPRLIGYEAGFPVYDTGFLVMTKIKRPLWIPVSQERFIRNYIRESKAQLAKSREQAARGTPYEQWLKEEPQRCNERGETARRLEEDYQRLKKSDPQAAENMRRSMLQTLQLMEQTEKEAGERMKAEDASFREGTRKGLEFQEQFIGKLEAELASLSPAERAAPAYVFGERAGRRPSGLVDAITRGCEMLVETNRDFFDPNLPQSAVQLIALKGLAGAQARLEESERRNAASLKDEKYFRNSGVFMMRKKAEICRTLNWQGLASLLD
jgi:hypothetical protein